MKISPYIKLRIVVNVLHFTVFQFWDLCFIRWNTVIQSCTLFFPMVDWNFNIYLFLSSTICSGTSLNKKWWTLQTMFLLYSHVYHLRWKQMLKVQPSSGSYTDDMLSKYCFLKCKNYRKQRGERVQYRQHSGKCFM